MMTDKKKKNDDNLIIKDKECQNPFDKFNSSCWEIIENLDQFYEKIAAQMDRILSKIKKNKDELKKVESTTG